MEYIGKWKQYMEEETDEDNWSEYFDQPNLADYIGDAVFALIFVGLLIAAYIHAFIFGGE